jgi:putative oxygen-independent coproporphyrinogen III oxidase
VAAPLSFPPLSVYVHFPWCVSKCPYCDFNSHALREALPEDRYVDTLIEDLRVQAARANSQHAQRQVISVFMGGGTPSLFSPRAIARVIDALRATLPLSADAEITLEANPATVERGRFTEYRAAGINRVSLGAQSFDPRALKALGRIHRVEDVHRAAAELHGCGLTNFNLDLMYALPGQTLAGALSDLTSALALAPAHLSHYQLTLEPGTVFAHNPPPLPDDDLAFAMQTECHAVLARHGFAQYETSAFSRAGHQCAHNLNYWNFGDYLGLGAGAHGKLTTVMTAALAVGRSTHLREPRRYLASAAGGPEWRIVPQADLPFEFMMNALRLTAGFTREQFVARTGLPIEMILPQLADLAGEGLVEATGSGWRPSPRGQLFLNDVIARFLPAKIHKQGRAVRGSSTASGSAAQIE